MKFTVQDTASIYRKIIAEKDAEKKKAIFRDELLKPYEGLFNTFGGSLNPKHGQMDAMFFLHGLPYKVDELMYVLRPRIAVIDDKISVPGRNLGAADLLAFTEAFQKGVP